jgi:hypothetical protein
MYAPHITSTIIHFIQKTKECIIASSWRGVEMYICFWMGICTAKLVILIYKYMILKGMRSVSKNKLNILGKDIEDSLTNSPLLFL